jgi:hypothetical protein
VEQFVVQHWFAVSTIVAYIAIAAVNALPDPSQKFEFYPWFYHVLKSLMNAVPAQYRPKQPAE